MARVLSVIFSLIFTLSAFSQTLCGKVVDEGNRPLEAVSVVVTGEGNNTLAFGYSDKGGAFSIMAKDGATQIAFSMMGYEKVAIDLKDFKDGQTVSLKSKSFVLKEVKVRPDKITQAEDTLNYNVAQFQQGQDRSIADVIKNMPGLEVSVNGQISFEGKPINKFYIEGMDLMGSKYAQASENLQAKNVKTVQVVQNHQPIKSLRGVQFSDQAAINLVLKEDAKNAWAGTADVGVGVPLRGGAVLYDGRLMAMMFSKKHQNLSMYKANNSGKDIVHEITDLATFLRGRQEMDGLLSNVTASAPDLDDKRTNFNTSHTIATNELIRTRQGNDFRIQADWLWNRQKSEQYSETEYTDIGGIMLSEETNVSAINNRIKADLTYKINKDKVYLNNQLHGYIDFDRSFGSTLLNGNESRQSVRPRKRYITEDFETLKTLKNGNVLNFSSQTTYSDLPGQLLTVLNSTEKLNLSGFETNNTLSFRQRIKAFTIKHEAGVNVKSQRMTAEYQDIRFSETNNQYDLFLTPSVNYEHGAWRMNVSMKADLLKASSLDKPHLSLQPRLNLKYDISGTTTLQTSYSYSESTNSLTSIYTTPLFTSYRTQTCYTGKFENFGSHRASLAFNYKQPVRGNFLTLEGTWIRRTNNILYQSQYAEPVYLRLPTDNRYDANTYFLRAHASKSIYWGKTSVSLTATQNWSEYCLLDLPPLIPAAEGQQQSLPHSGELEGTITNWQMQTTTVAFRLTMTPTKIFSYELRSQLNSSRQKLLSNPSGEGRGEAVSYFKHSLDLYLFPHKNWEISLKNSLYHSTDKTVSTTYFADAHISYKQNRYELRLTASNLLGKDKFERRTIGTTTNLYSVYKLRPREFLLSFSLDL